MAGLLTLFLLLLAWLLLVVTKHKYAKQNKTNVLTAVSRELLEEMEPHQTADGDFPEMMEEIQEAINITGERLVVLRVDEGEVVARSHPHEPKWPNGSKDWLTAVLPYHGEQLVVALFYGEVRRELRERTIYLGLAAFGCLLVITGSTWYLVGHVLSPIGHLSRQARAAESNLDTRLETPSSDSELVELVSTLNQFLDGMARNSEMRSRFYSAASHELRTPLQALSGHLELALTKERTAGEYKHSLEEAREQTRRLIRLTQDLLLLNRLETSSQAKRQPLDLGDYCENAWSVLEPSVKAKELKAQLSLDEECEVLTTPSYLDSLCRNLLENAVKYSTFGGRVEVQVADGHLRVYNDCTPLEPDDFKKLTEPFFRPDVSRTSSTGGNGLGLSLVSAIAEHENWDFQFTQTPTGFEVTINLAKNLRSP